MPTASGRRLIGVAPTTVGHGARAELAMATAGSRLAVARVGRTVLTEWPTRWSTGRLLLACACFTSATRPPASIRITSGSALMPTIWRTRSAEADRRAVSGTPARSSPGTMSTQFGGPYRWASLTGGWPKPTGCPAAPSRAQCIAGGTRETARELAAALGRRGPVSGHRRSRGGGVSVPRVGRVVYAATPVRRPDGPSQTHAAPTARELRGILHGFDV